MVTGRWALARRQHRPRSTAGRAVKGKTILPGLYLSWSPRSCRRRAPRAGRPRRRPGTAPCLGRRHRPPPELPAARWRRGAERAGSGSSSARPQDGGCGMEGWAPRSLLAGGVLWGFAYRAPSAAPLRDSDGKLLREEAGCSFQSQPVLPTTLIPHEALWDGPAERCLQRLECSSV